MFPQTLYFAVYHAFVWVEVCFNLVHLQGSDVVYDTFLRPIVMQYEPNIEQRLLHLRAKSGQLISFYMKNFADKGTAFFMDVLRYVVSEKPEGSNAEVMAISPSDLLSIACTVLYVCSLLTHGIFHS